MKLIKPDWVNHGDKPIFSIDVHPNGTKFATGGQGSDSGRIVIWNIIPVLSLEMEADESVVKILCQLDNHLACVNCVRFSLNGTMLASGGDDKVIMIWRHIKGGGGSTAGFGFNKCHENWRCVTTLRGHAGDILDLAWSPQDRWLASSSVDNNIIVWDMNNFQTMVAVLKGHTGLVKGVAWDPVGKYLSSQSDDRSIKIWKTADWQCQKTIVEPFEDCGGTTHILRLSWSPDGLYLVSAHAMNGGGSTAQIIEREGWKCDKDFVGHRKAVTCVRFHNSILKRQSPNSNKPLQYCCLAIGSRDHSLSIWMTALQRPLVVIHDLFQESILDLSWNTHNNILLACSTDGAVACLQFTADELGTPLSEEEKNSLYQRMYGTNATVSIGTPAEKNTVVEFAELLETDADAVKTKSQQNSISNSNHVINSSNGTSQMGFGGSDGRTAPITPSKAIHRQIETRTADGRRRITPVFIPLNQDSISEPLQDFGSQSMTPELIRTPVVDSLSINSINKEIPQQMTAVLPTLIVKGPEQITLDSRLSRIIPPNRSTITPEQPRKPIEQQPTTQSGDCTTKLFKAGHVQQLGNVTGKSNPEYRVYVSHESFQTAYGSVYKITCMSSIQMNRKIWESYVGSPIVNFCICLKYVMICCKDGSIKFYDIATGRLALPIIKLKSPAVQCSFSLNNKLGGIVTECGLVKIWNLDESIIFSSTTCTELLNGVHVTHFHISEKGIAFIMLANGCSYSYCKNLDSWLVLNSSDPVFRIGLSTITHTQNKNLRTFPLASLQASTSLQPNTRNLTDNNEWQHDSKYIFIENQIKLAEAINSSDELRHWYNMLGIHLASHGCERQIRIILDDLLSIRKTASDKEILDIKKIDLFHSVLTKLQTNPRWHRLYMEYEEQANGFRTLV